MYSSIECSCKFNSLKVNNWFDVYSIGHGSPHPTLLCCSPTATSNGFQLSACILAVALWPRKSLWWAVCCMPPHQDEVMRGQLCLSTQVSFYFLFFTKQQFRSTVNLSNSSSTDYNEKLSILLIELSPYYII
jgi:hypothetical protein